jgi:hypothetical protein
MPAKDRLRGPLEGIADPEKRVALRGAFHFPPLLGPQESREGHPFDPEIPLMVELAGIRGALGDLDLSTELKDVPIGKHRGRPVLRQTENASHLQGREGLPLPGEQKALTPDLGDPGKVTIPGPPRPAVPLVPGKEHLGFFLDEGQERALGSGRKDRTVLQEPLVGPLEAPGQEKDA